MCGVAGCLLSRPSQGNLRNLSTLLNGIRQRGPDDEGALLVHRTAPVSKRFATDRSVAPLRERLPRLVPQETGLFDLALLHTRYAIIDLSAEAHQPFASADGGITAAWNGEIYNYRELRGDLAREGVVFRSASDTEVLVEGYRRWGDGLWPRLNGFWAVALYDATSRALVVSRDRMGVAPLYYRETGEGLYFASLARPLQDLDPPGPLVDTDAVRGFLAVGLKDFDGATSFRDVRSFPPATVLRFPAGAASVSDAVVRRFWEYPARRLTTRDLSLNDAADRLREVLVDAVALRRRSDRPVAYELSGGLDSSSIVACAAAASTTPVPTYTISVPEHNEEPFARTLRQRFALDYRVLRDVEAPFAQEAAQFARVVEEPYHSPNVFTCYAMRRAMQRDGIAVVVSGSGGDEALGGYEYEFWPAASRDLRARGAWWHATCNAAGVHLGSRPRLALTVAELIGKAKQILRPRIVAGAGLFERPGSTHAEVLLQGYSSMSFHEQTLFHFQVAQLPYYLRSNDHFTMSLPIEHRFPFLDFRLVDFALRLPVEYLFRNGWSKYVLRRAMAPLLPPAVVWRREKAGFPFPLQRFLRTNRAALQQLPESVLSAGLIDARPAYDDLVRRDPDLLWRICSTGYWLTAT